MTARRAVQLLEGEGLVARYPVRGTFVAGIRERLLVERGREVQPPPDSQAIAAAELRQSGSFIKDMHMTFPTGSRNKSMEIDPHQIKQLIRQVIREELRIGRGIDFHSLYEGYPLVLAGVTIPHNKGFRVKRSDGDPVAHAIVDALLAAMGKGDIADWFSDQDGVTGARSIEYLGELEQKVLRPYGVRLISVQVIILAERPKLKSFFPQMQKHIAEQLGIGEEQVSIQGKTFEGKGIVGRQEGIEVEVIVALLTKAVHTIEDSN